MTRSKTIPPAPPLPKIDLTLALDLAIAMLEDERIPAGDIEARKERQAAANTVKELRWQTSRPRAIVPLPMSLEENRAYSWALSQQFNSVSARMARILAEYIQKVAKAS